MPVPPAGRGASPPVQQQSQPLWIQPFPQLYPLPQHTNTTIRTRMIQSQELSLLLQHIPLPRFLFDRLSYAAVTGKSYDDIEREFDGQGYGAFKPAVGEAVVEALRPIREETQRLLADKAYLESLYRQGAEKAAAMANRTLRKVHKKVGFVPR